MRITRIEIERTESGTATIAIYFSENGVQAYLTLSIPPEWETWNLEERIAWGRTAIADHLAHYRYARPGEAVWPDPDTAADEETHAGELEEQISAEIAWLDAAIPQIPTADLAALRTGLQRLARENLAMLKAWRYVLRRL